MGTNLTFSIGQLTDTTTFTRDPGDPTTLRGHIVTQWISADNLIIQVAVQAKNDQDQTNINPSTVRIRVSTLNLPGVNGTMDGYCNVSIPSGLCVATVTIPKAWFDNVNTPVTDAVSVSAWVTGAVPMTPIGTINAQVAPNECTTNNHILVQAPTYSQFTGQKVYIPVYGLATEGVGNFLVRIQFSSGLSFASVEAGGYFDVDYEAKSGSYFLSGVRVSSVSSTRDLLFTLKLTAVATACSDERVDVKINFLADTNAQTVSYVI